MTTKRSIFEDVGADKGQSGPPKGGMIAAAPKGARRGIRAWLFVLFALVVVMIAVGGLTRLTDSGLSITEWNLVKGAVPPTSEADWAVAFEKYRTSPEYLLQNKGMELAEFKVIYWWEWGHRQLGRVIGLVWAVGFAGFALARQIPKGWTPRLLLLGALGGAQGAIGWWMVSSGLQGARVDVASYRLATHLGLAFVILGLIAWYALALSRPEAALLQARRGREDKLLRLSTGLMHAAFLQIILGALVAGIDAGRSFPTWPLMGDSFFPADAFYVPDGGSAWRAFFENPGLVQFIHRMMGYLLLAFGVVVWARGRRSAHRRHCRGLSCDVRHAAGADGAGHPDGSARGPAWPRPYASTRRGAAVGADHPRPPPVAVSDHAIHPGNQMTAFQDLMAFQRDTEALAQIAGRLGWDQETMMPRGAAEQRGEETGAIEGVLHARRTDPRLADWLAAAKAPDAAGARAIALIRRGFDRNACIPARLASEIARVTSVAQGTWAEARERNDVAHFLPTLERVVALKREAGQALAAGGFGGGDTYDALLDDYEPGATAAGIGAIFDRMRPRLVALRDRVMGAARQPKPLQGSYAEDRQLGLARDLATAFGYDWNRGRLDLAVHPFSSGSGNDARITTRVVETDPFNCAYSTIHEVGHACYELGIDQAHLLTPLGCGVSMGVHESQSRIYENQLGRGRRLYRLALFPDACAVRRHGRGRRGWVLCHREPGAPGLYPHRGR